MNDESLLKVTHLDRQVSVEMNLGLTMSCGFHYSSCDRFTYFLPYDLS